MAIIERQWFKRGDETALFEIGYKTLKPGCDYVFDPITGKMEYIWDYELGSVEGKDVERVETRSGWHEVDGITVFARKVESYRKTEL